VPDEDLRLLLDQNVPQAISTWLKKKLPGWEVLHVNELGFQGKRVVKLFFSKAAPLYRSKV